MARKCGTCQHIKRAEIDRRIAAGEPGGQIARDYDLNPSSLHRHRTNCLKLSSSNAIMKEVCRGLPRLRETIGCGRCFSLVSPDLDNIYSPCRNWAGVRKAMGSLDRGESVPHEQVKAWVHSWGGKRERPAPKRSAK
jgi:hypothetical protein